MANHLKKLQELILYIAQEGEDDPCLGAIKLNKILYYSDFNAYIELGRSITNATYQHLLEGPAPRELLPARESLEKSGAISLEPTRYFNQVQTRIVAKRPPNLAKFNEAELRIVREVMHYLEDLNATEVSELSHREWGWRLTEEGEDIPYRTAWLSAEPLTQEQVQYGRQLWEEIGAQRS